MSQPNSYSWRDVCLMRNTTPAERFTRIENLLSAMTERQAVHDEQLAENARQIEKNTRQIEKNTAGIRDLVTVNRTLVDTVGQLRDAMAEGFARTDKFFLRDFFAFCKEVTEKKQKYRC